MSIKDHEITVLRMLTKDFVANYPEQKGIRPIWRKPLLASAKVDRRFNALKQMVSQDHLLPRDLLTGARSVVVFFIPFTEELVRENFGGKLPARSWGQAYVATNTLIKETSAMLWDHLTSMDFEAELTPATHNFSHSELISRWSHKHLGLIAGLGRFGHNSLLITPAGCTGRLGSLVTVAELGDHPLVTGEQACLHKAGEKCLKCVSKCPVRALTEEGFDRFRCWDRLRYNRTKTKIFDGLPNDTDVCAKCAMDLPCTFEAPVR